MYVVVEDPRRGLTLVEPRRRETWLCRRRAGRLDRELAAGLSPERDRARGVWACLVVGPRERRLAARSLQRLLEAADDPSPTRALRLTRHQRAALLDAREPVQRLVDRLLARRPVAATGMAKLRVLLSDGGGPLHSPDRTGDLARAVEDVVDALDAPLLRATDG